GSSSTSRRASEARGPTESARYDLAAGRGQGPGQPPVAGPLPPVSMMVTSADVGTRQAREAFLRAHAGAVYAELTDGMRETVRVEELVVRAAERFPGLTPSPAEIAARRDAEVDQGVFLAHVLAEPRAGRHLVNAMLRPKRDAERLL